MMKIYKTTDMTPLQAHSAISTVHSWSTAGIYSIQNTTHTH